MTRSDWIRAACLLWLGLGLVLGGAHYWTILPPVAVYAALAIDGVARAGSGWLMPVVRHGDRQVNHVALTFDDGPDPALTPLVLDALRAHDARATFFVIGRRARCHPELLRRMREDGHELGNHSYTHSRVLNLRTRGPMRKEILRATRLLSRWVPGNARVPYRPPMGLKNPALARLQSELGLRVVAWSLHARDTRRRDARAIAARVLARIRPGDIVLFHDGHDLPGRHRGPQLAEALERILPELRRRGLQTVTVSELLAPEQPREAEAGSAMADSGVA